MFTIHSDRHVSYKSNKTVELYRLSDDYFLIYVSKYRKVLTQNMEYVNFLSIGDFLLTSVGKSKLQWDL